MDQIDLNAEIRTVEFRELSPGEFFIRRRQLPAGVVYLYKKTAGGYSPIVLGPVDEEEEVVRVLVAPSVIF